jgi:hypothetical protein
MQWMRKAAENGQSTACLQLATFMYGDHPYAREVGHVEEAAGVAPSARVMEGHDVPPDVLTGVIHWVRKGADTTLVDEHMDDLRRRALEGGAYCRNEGSEVKGLLKDFKVCPQCKGARYRGAACQKEDWNTGGHRANCGKLFSRR